MNARWLAILVLGCGGPERGVRVEVPGRPARTAVLASSRTSECGGLRVLWNGRVRGFDLEQRGFVAGSRAELSALWREVNPPAPEPALDLATHCVFGFVGRGYECPREVVALEAEPNEVLRARIADEPWSCADVAVRRALVLAVPRRLLGRTVTVVSDDGLGFSFRVPSPGEALRPLEPAAPGATAATPAGEQVELPERGKISLRRLADGTELWVAHHTDGSVDALAASVSLREFPSAGLGAFFASVLSYRPELGRLGGVYDAHGRNVHGSAALQAFAVVRTDAAHVAVGGPIPSVYAPIQARADAPALEGPDSPYSTLVPGRDWANILDGQVAVLDADVVVRMDRPAELCHAPPAEASFHSFSCPAGSPRVEGSAGGEGSYIVYGQFVVRRHKASVGVTLLKLRTIRGIGS